MQQQGQQRQALDRESIEALESQIEFELRRSGASGQQGGGGVPLSSGSGAKRSLGQDIDASGQLAAAAAAAGCGWALQQGAAEGGPEGGAGGMVFGSLGDAIGSLEYSSAGEEGPAGGSYGEGSKGSGADLTTAGLAHFAAKLRNGGITPGGNQLAPAGGSGRYSTSLDESLDSQQWAAAAAAGASGRQAGVARAAGAPRTRPPGVPALSISRISIADLLEDSAADASLQQHQQLLGGQPHLQPVSRQEQASISKLAASMHSGGMAAGVTPADIRAALAGAAVLQRCWGASRGSSGCLVLAGMLLVACGRLSCCRFTSLGMTLLLCSLCRLLCWHARRLGCC